MLVLEKAVFRIIHMAREVMSGRKIQNALCPKNVAAILGGIVIILVLLHLITGLLAWVIESDVTRRLKHLFNLDVEKNIPTYFAICLWVMNGALFLMVWQVQRVKNRWQNMWLILSGLFCFLAIDEYISIHEGLVPHLRSALGTSGIFYFGWIIPYGTGLILLAIFMIPVVLRLDRKNRFWYNLSAATFVTGSIGIEMVEGWYLDMMNHQRDIIYYVMMTFEESLEMAGLAVLAFANLLLLQKEHRERLSHLSASRNAFVFSNKP